MHILIFGASGATGQHLVKQALDQRYDVTAFVRDTGKLSIKHEKLRLIQGNVIDYEKVKNAMGGQDAVLSVLGANSPFKFDQAVVDGLGNIIKAMESTNVQRLIYLSTIGVKDSRNDAGFFIRHIAPLLLRTEIAGHEAREKMIRQSHLKYTIVHLTKLTNGKQTGKYMSGETLKTNAFVNNVSRADTAEFILKQLTDNTYICKTVRVMSL
jgi:putative NADH-flavin reductase